MSAGHRAIMSMGCMDGWSPKLKPCQFRRTKSPEAANESSHKISLASVVGVESHADQELVACAIDNASWVPRVTHILFRSIRGRRRIRHVKAIRQCSATELVESGSQSSRFSKAGFEGLPLR